MHIWVREPGATVDLDEFTRAFVARFEGGRGRAHRRRGLPRPSPPALEPGKDRVPIGDRGDEDDYARTHEAVNRRKPGDGFPFNPTA
jgi:hypothetical protein